MKKKLSANFLSQYLKIDELSWTLNIIERDAIFSIPTRDFFFKV